MGHVEDRAKERTSITDKEIASARSYVKNHRKVFLKGHTYSIVAPGRKGYYIVGDVGDKRKKHVIKTIYGVNMRPPGTLIQNAQLEHDLIKAAEALFSLEKTASAVSYSIALMECDKLASAYFGYDLDEWLVYPEEMRKEAMFNWARSINAYGNRGLSKLYGKMGWQGGAQRAAGASSQSFTNLARNNQARALKTTDIDKATQLQTQAANNSINASRQSTFAGNAEKATRQAEHANTQLDAAARHVANDASTGANQISSATKDTLKGAEEAFERKITKPAVANNTAASTKPTVINNTQQVTPQSGAPAPGAPASDAANPINWKQVGVGAGLATAGIGAGVGGVQYMRHRNSQVAGMPKMASWYSFVDKTASYTDALGMYKEALSSPQPPATSAPSQPLATARPSAPLSNTVIPEAAPTKNVANVVDDAAKSVTPKAATPKAAPKGRLGMLLGGAALTGAGLYGLNRMMQPSQEKAAEVEYRGRKFPGYNKPVQSDRPNKKKMVLAKKGDQVKLVHYGHTGYKHNYSKDAKKNYLTRSAGIRDKSGNLTKDDKFSANYWARRDLWPQGQKADGSDKKR